MLLQMLRVEYQNIESRCMTLTDKLEVMSQELQSLQREKEALTIETMSMHQLKKDQ